MHPLAARLAALSLGALLLAGTELALRATGFRYERTEPAFRFMGMDVLLDEERRAQSLFLTDPVLFWRLRPGAPIPDGRNTAEAVNEQGFRGRPVPAQRTPGVLRVASLGDSSTFGVQVPFERSYVERVRRALEDRLGPTEIVDAGCHGYSSYQGRQLLERRILPLEPDVVTFYFGAWNDLVPAIGERDAQKAERLDATVSLAGLSALAQRLRLYDVVLRAVVWMKSPESDVSTKAIRDEYSAAFRRGSPPDGRRVSVAEFRDNLAAMIRLSRAAGAEPVLITPPLPGTTQQEFPIHQDYRRAVVDVAEAEGAVWIDVAAAFDARAAEGEELFADWVHPNREGHRLIAELLTPSVVEALAPAAERRLLRVP